MTKRAAGVVGWEVLLGDAGDVLGLVVLGAEMVERLVLDGGTAAVMALKAIG